MLELRNITKIFQPSPNDEIKVALDNVSLKIEDGEFVTIIGSNGSGKSTLMNIICGVFKPDAGTILIDGIDVTKQAEDKRAKYLGRVFQDPRLGTATSMNVLENLELAYSRGFRRRLRWGFKKEHKEVVLNRISNLGLGLESHLNQKIGSLSGGQRQAITLLMATVQVPKLLLLDEHTAALDPKTAAIVLDLTESIVKENQLTTLMITHNMRDAIRYGNRLIMLNDGKIVLDIKGEDKQKLTIEELIQKFEKSSDDVVITSDMVL